MRKKQPKRLYVRTGNKMYTRKRRANKKTLRPRRKLFRGGIRTHFTRVFKDFVYYFIVGGIFLILFIFLFFSSYFRITNVEVVRGNFNVDSAAIENDLNKYIGKNILFFQKRLAVKSIEDKYPEFSEIIVKKVLPHSISVELTSYPVVANLRAFYILPDVEKPVEEFKALEKAIHELEGVDELPPEPEITEEISPLEDAVVTNSVFSLEPAPEEEILVETKEELTPIEQRSLLNRIGQAIFDQEENLELMTISVRGLSQPVQDREIVIERDRMDYIFESLEYLKGVSGLEVLNTDYLPIAREVHFRLSNNLTLWINMERPYKTQVDKFAAIYQAAELDKEDLSYIDLRIREKVIYCPRYATCDK